ncbi:ABC-type glycerol-3-phosphate transport system substrate-binding protein [Ereboglobus sp. PH5-10]|uniref:hypothetical protein n=1 Tax=Ereboglobus sp. PH5-10 TaxID=2940629 RepID=UPI0024075AB1|nr:hypothetical protein [Ereboglobus sp. PH5-10]MDF9826899.1 ABC-type glycerol-3-phosphate transport system substrate-binding protein [Ereboglobus sp. PH5-10]
MKTSAIIMLLVVGTLAAGCIGAPRAATTPEASQLAEAAAFVDNAARAEKATSRGRNLEETITRLAIRRSFRTSPATRPEIANPFHQ